MHDNSQVKSAGKWTGGAHAQTLLLSPLGILMPLDVMDDLLPDLRSLYMPFPSLHAISMPVSPESGLTCDLPAFTTPPTLPHIQELAW